MNIQLIEDLAVQSNWRGSLLYLKVYLAILSVFVLNEMIGISDSPLLTLLAIIFIAGRQHSLYVLNHDASHGSLFKTRKLNRWVSTLLSIAPMFHHPEAWSFVQWKRIHLLHHKNLFTQQDPNYRTRVSAGDTQKKISLLKLMIKCLISPFLSVYGFFFAKQDYCPKNSEKWERKKINHLQALLMPLHGDQEMQDEWTFKWVFFTLMILFLDYFNLMGTFLLFWIVPMYTVYPMILTYFDLTEHYWESGSQEPEYNTRTVEHGFLVSLLLTHLPRGLHREHHYYPRVPAVNLPVLKMVLDRHKNEVLDER